MAPSDSRSVNRCGRGHFACKFSINVTVLSSILIAHTEAERFERGHRLFGYQSGTAEQLQAKLTEAQGGQAGAPARNYWNAFTGAVARRVHDEGMPASQGELIRDMLDWFAASGAVPDESTVRRRVQTLWPVLTRRA
jgi:hypothetical protein